MIEIEWQPVIVIDGQDNHLKRWEPTSDDWGTLIGKRILVRKVDATDIPFFYYKNVEGFRKIVGCDAPFFVEVHPDYVPPTMKYGDSVIMCSHMFHTD